MKLANSTRQPLIGRRRVVPRWPVPTDSVRSRRRWAFTKKPMVHLVGRSNPKNLADELQMSDKRPAFWLFGLIAIAVLPQLTGNTRLLTVATTFAIFAAVNLMWSLVIDTAGLLSLATLAVVGAGAYIVSWLSISHGLPWFLFLPVGAAVGAVFGAIIALPVRRMDGMYFALLTMGVAELCRVYVLQSDTFGRSAGGSLFGADSYIPADWAGKLPGARLGFAAAFLVLLAALAVYRAVAGERLGLLLATARDDEAFAEAVGIDYFRVRLEVFIISSIALGAIGGFYAATNRGAGASLFSLDQTLLLLAMIVIGGAGRAEGAVVGTLIVTFLDDWLIGLGAKRIVLIGALMLVTALLSRAGLFGIKSQFRDFRERTRSERRARRAGKRGVVLPEEAIEIHDKDQIAWRRFDKRTRDHLKTLVSPDVIEEHRRNPLGQHTEALERILTYFRKGPLADKYAVFAKQPFAEYQVVAISGRLGIPPRLVDETTYATLPDAYHAVFLRRINDLMSS